MSYVIQNFQIQNTQNLVTKIWMMISMWIILFKKPHSVQRRTTKIKGQHLCVQILIVSKKKEEHAENALMKMNISFAIHRIKFPLQNNALGNLKIE
ncbi:hypothetical protein pb186bvf_000436 [Paramecium bursaria]